MVEPYTGLKKVKFGFLGWKWNQADYVVLLMYDGSNHTFGYITQRVIESVRQNVATGLTRNPPQTFAKQVLEKMSDTQKVKLESFDPKFEYYGSVVYKHQTRHYVRVTGRNFSALADAGYQTFDPAGDLVSVLGQKNGPAFAEILGKYPLLNRQVA